jgi:hypothetical protein
MHLGPADGTRRLTALHITRTLDRAQSSDAGDTERVASDGKGLVHLPPMLGLNVVPAAQFEKGVLLHSLFACVGPNRREG